MSNTGTVAGRSIVNLTAENVHNLGGRISGNDTRVTARTDLNNIGGTIDGANSLAAIAGRDLNVASTTSSASNQTGGTSNNNFSLTGLDRVAGLYVTSQTGGTLVASAGRDANLIAGIISNKGAAGSTTVTAQRDLTLGTVGTSSSSSLVRGDGTNFLEDRQSTDVGSQINTQGNLSLGAGRDLNAKAASVQAGGDLAAVAGNNINITAGQQTNSSSFGLITSEDDLFSSSSTTERRSGEQTNALGSSVGGKTVTAVAGNDQTVTGSSVISDAGTALGAGNNLTIQAAANTSKSTSFKETKESGLMSSGGAGVTIGSLEQSIDQKTQGTTAAASTVGSIAGDVRLQAGSAYKQVGSDVAAPGGNIDVKAKQVDIVEARETSQTVVEQKFKQEGLTLEVTSPVLSAVQTAQQMSQAASNTGDGRMKGLAAANVAFAANKAADAIRNGQGTNINGKEGQMATGKDVDGNVTSRDATAAEKAGGIDLAISIGGSQNQSRQESQSDTARGSSVTAAGDVNIKAIGAGQDSNLTVRGSVVEAGRNVQLQADNEIRLQAAQNTASQNSTNSSSASSVGISYGTSGLMFNASGSKGSGKADGNDTSYTNTEIKAGNQVAITSGGNTTLLGAVVKADQIKATVGGDLKIESLQDTSTYISEQKNASASISIGYGKGSGSVSASNSNINSDFKSVGEQSGIKAGDGGFQVNVQGNTDLKGGVIASNRAAVDQGKNSFTTGGTLNISDIQNSASYEGKSSGFSLGGGAAADTKGISGLGIGLGSDKKDASSITSAGISGIAGNTAVRSTDAETGLKPIFDADKVQREINAQMQITQAFSREAPKAVASFSASQAAALRDQKMENEAKKWDEGGVYRIALHIAVGALGGGFDGAAGAATSASSANLMNALQDGIQRGLVDAGLSDSAAKALAQSVATLTVAGVGAAVAGAQGAATAATVDANNRQLHPTEAQLIKANASKYAALRKISVEKAEAELTQQALRDVDTAHAERLGTSDVQAQAFLKELGAGQSLVDPSTGQRFELFAADETTRTNHAMFGQYVKNNPTVEAALDRAYLAAFKPAGGQTIAGLNGSNAGALTGSDLALNDAARDYRNMRQQPPAVQWSVLGELRQERRENLGTQLKLTQELQDLNSKNDASASAVLRRGEIFIALIQLDQENTTLRQASVEQLKAMGSNGLLNPADQREWIEGVGEALAGGGLGLRGLSAASIAGRLNMLKSTVEEVRVSSAAAKAEAQAIANARVENNLGRDGALDPYAPVPNAQAQADLRAKAAVDAANGVSNPHYDPKHGPTTSLQQQYDRAMIGTNPQTGAAGRPADASKFFNATDMETAITQAEAIYAGNPAAYTNRNGQVNVKIDFNRPVGEGYIGDTRLNRANAMPIGEYRWSNTATVGIDPSTGKAYTAYPNMSVGVAKPDPLKMGVQR